MTARRAMPRVREIVEQLSREAGMPQPWKCRIVVGWRAMSDLLDSEWERNANGLCRVVTRAYTYRVEMLEDEHPDEVRLELIG